MNKLVKPALKCLSIAATACVLFATSCNNSTEANNEGDHALSLDSTASLTPAWKTDTVLTGAESTLYNPGNNTIYVSCGNTNPTEKDGDGFIALLSPEGKITKKDWVTGLNAPKGMAILNGKLYVTDIDEVKVIDLESAKVVQTIPVAGAQFLNDLASDGKTIYFSDSKTGIIHSLDQDGNVKSIVENATGINGLECYDGALYSLDEEGLKKFDVDYKSTILNTEVTGGDGLVILNDSTFIASRWIGEIYLIKGKETTLLLDTKEAKSNTADIGFIPGQNIVLVPTFMKNEVAAYTF